MTGCGKSTTIQKLCGSKMGMLKAITSEGFKEYIGVQEYNEEMVNIEDIKEVQIGPEAKSCTSVIKVITVNKGTENEAIVVDAPGFGD